MLKKIQKSYQKIIDYHKTNKKEDHKTVETFSFDQVEAILSNISDAVAVVGKDFNIVAFNQTAKNISGYKIEEAVGQRYDTILRVYRNRRVEIDDKLIDRTIKTNKKKELANVSTLINKAGEKIIISGCVSPYKNNNGEIDGCVIIFRDLTKEREIDVLKTEFVSLASHQLRTPLTAIRWFIEELYNEELGALNPEQKDYVRQVMESNTRMIKLVNDLLDVSRLEAARIKIDPKLTDLSKLAKDVVSYYLPVSRANNCQVIFKETDEVLPKIKIDPSLIREVLSNLISNAVKYSHNKTGENSVFISMTKRSSDIMISVQDSGIGIPQKFQRRIFQKFFRADNVAKIDTGGTGFGLYISKMLVEASGGRIWFESEENKGTTFYFTLPLSGSEARSGERGLTSEEEGLNIKI